MESKEVSPVDADRPELVVPSIVMDEDTTDNYDVVKMIFRESDDCDEINTECLSGGDNTAENYDSDEVFELKRRRPVTKRVWELRRKTLAPVQLLSPISEMGLNLRQFNICSPISSRSSRMGELNDDGQFRNAETTEDTTPDNGMISNSFTLNSSSKPKPERPQLNRMNALMPTALCLNNNNNNNNNNSPKKSDNMVIDEYTFFGAHSPNGSSRAGSLSPPGSISPNELSPTRCDIQHKQLNALHIKRSFDETDTTSTDSGYGTYDINNTVKQYSFKFTQPNGFAPRRATPSPPKVMCQHPHINHMSPMKPNESPKQKLPQLISDCSQSFNYDSSDEDYNLFDMDAFDEETQLPTDFNSLLSGHIKSQRQTTPKNKEFVRRCLSMTDSNVIKTPKSCLFGGSMGTPEVCNSPKSTDSLTPIRAFKRPEPPTISPILSKRYKYETEKEDQENQMEIEMLNNVGTAAIARPAFRKSVSMNDAVIRSALARSSSDPDLIGDFSKKFCLPMVSGKHADLKSITNDTMARLVRGEYSDNVATYKIIDCRYPYEYEGGHIRGAQNLFTCDQIVDELVNIKTDNASVDMAETNGKRHILVFHCEFSSERGPKLSRFLRKLDRERNTHSYPALHYPEVYLLHGGYKDFYGNFPELCDPISYRPMDDPSYSEAYRLFRAKTRSWSGDTKSSGTASRFIRRDDRSRSRLIL